MIVDWLRNRRACDRLALDPPVKAPLTLHRSLRGYAVTPLHVVDGPGKAVLLLKDETSRMGLPAFKILGASWAARRAVDRAAGTARRLVTATDGNHGRAVARTAALLGLASRVYVPADMREARRAAIRSEGAHVVDVDGTYDDAVAAAAAGLGTGDVLVADTGAGGDEGGDGTASQVADGYGTPSEVADGAYGAAVEILADGERRVELELPDAPAVLVLLTEGATDPDAWAQITTTPTPRADAPLEDAP